MSAGLVSTVAGLLGLVLAVVAVALSPAPAWAAVGTAAAELLAVACTVGQHQRRAEAEVVETKPGPVKAAA